MQFLMKTTFSLLRHANVPIRECMFDVFKMTFHYLIRNVLTCCILGFTIFYYFFLLLLKLKTSCVKHISDFMFIVKS